MPIQTLNAGSSYILRLYPEKPLTSCQIEQVINLLQEKQPEIEQFGVQLRKMEAEPSKIDLTVYSNLTIEVDPFLYFLVTIFGALGIAVIAYEIIAVLAASPLVWIFGICGLAFGAYLIYTWRTTRRRF
jgi:hypothetical protein